MKHKSSKRSSSNKQFHPRAYPIQIRRTSISIEIPTALVSNTNDYNTNTVHVESDTACMKPDVSLRNPRQLKRDLLRCSNQRPTLFGVQTLQTPRHRHHHHHALQQTQSHASSSSTSSSFDRRHRSLSVHSHTFYATIDRLGPWPDISINRFRSTGNDHLRPLKNFRTNKHPRVFSPKYYAALAENTTQFKFHPSNRTYIEEYRKQKGYVLIPRAPQKQMTLLSISSSLKRDDDDQLSMVGSFNGEVGSFINRDRTDLSSAHVPLSARGITRSADDLLKYHHEHIPMVTSTSNPGNMFPSIPNRSNNNNNHQHPLRTIRQAQQQPTIHLPAINKTSFRYLNSIQAVEKAYREGKKPPKEHQSKVYLIDGRPKKRYAIFDFPHASKSMISTLRSSIIRSSSRLSTISEVGLKNSALLS